MCGLVALSSSEQASYLIHSALIALQHRGQDAVGMVTENKGKFHFQSSHGLVRDVFSNHDIDSLKGNVGIAHLRYPTSGSVTQNQIQPFYVNSPFGIAMAHNGTINNTEEFAASSKIGSYRHINSDTDSELLLNYMAYQLQKFCKLPMFTKEDLTWAIHNIFRVAKGAYSVVGLIAGHGIFAFRDPLGIRPLIIGKKQGKTKVEYIIASESVAIDLLGFEVVRDVAAGELIYISADGQFYSIKSSEKTTLSPCLFEYVYLARPDSTIDGISVYHARMEMGRSLAKPVQAAINLSDIDVVIPVPDTSRIAAYELASSLNIPYREGFIKNRYIDRTFIMPEQIGREIAVRHKLNPVKHEFFKKNILLVDDSIVRGTTSKEIVDMARASGAKKIFIAVASPPILYPNYYGINIPTSEELIAHNRSNEEIAKKIGCDSVVYLELSALTNALVKLNPAIKKFEDSCFSGIYPS